MEFVSKWYEEGEEEIKNSSFLWANDTVNKDEPMDFISWFCGIFSLSCLVIVLYLGITRGLTAPMIYLMVVYVLIAIFSFCQPVQIGISKFLWGTGFKNRIAINKGYDPLVKIQEGKVIITGANGEEEYTIDEDCFFFKSRNYVMLHITDKKLYTISKNDLETEGLLESILSLCVNLTAPVEEESEETLEEIHDGFEEESEEVPDTGSEEIEQEDSDEENNSKEED